MFSFYFFVWYSRQSFSVAVLENISRVQPVATAMRKAAESGGAEATKQKENFWMKDPKSGNWIPESHFGEIDVVDLREKLLPRQKKLM